MILPQINWQLRFAPLPRHPSLPRFAEGRDCRDYVQTRAITLENAQIYQTLAEDLQAIELQDQTLGKHRQAMATAYKHLATVMVERAELMDAEGSLTYRGGDTTMEQIINNLQVAEQEAYQELQRISQAYANYCLHNR